MEMHPNNRAVVAQKAHRQRSESGREEFIVVPTVEDALRRRVQRREMGVERVLGDGDDLVKSEHLRALNDPTRSVTVLVGVFQGPPAAVKLVGGVYRLLEHFPTSVAGIDNVVAHALEDVKVSFGEEFHDEPPGFLSKLIGVIISGELGYDVVVSGI